jgi:proliferating cell nuclear antigen
MPGKVTLEVDMGKYITQTLAKINDEGVLEITSDSVRAWIMSPDKTSLAILEMPSLSFEEYSVEEESKFVIRTDEFNKVIKRATRNDEVIIQYNVEEQAIEVELRDKKTGFSRRFLVPIVSGAQQELRELRIEPTARFTMMTDDFKALIQDVKVVGDILELHATQEAVRARAQGEEKEYEWVMRPGDVLLDLEVDEDAESSYSRQALEVATKPVGAAESVRIGFATNYPMKIEFTFPNGEKMDLYIAPSV